MTFSLKDFFLTAVSMSEATDKNIGAFWKETSKAGKIYFRGHFMLGVARLRCALIVNEYKESEDDGKPDFIILAE